MTYFLLISAIILGCIFKKSKIVSVYILCSMYLLAAFNYDNYDYYSYTISYAKTASTTFDYRYFGYSMFEHLFSSRGLTYSEYLKFAFIIVFVVLYIAIRSLTDKPNQVLALFMIFPFGIDAIQLKALFSEVFGLLGIAFLFEDISLIRKSFKNRRFVLSVICFLLSVLFHFSGAFNLAAVALFFLFRQKRWFNKTVILASLMGFVAVFSGILGKVMSIAGALGVISDTEYLSSYASRATNLGFIITFIPVLLMVGASWLIIRDDKKEEQSTTKQLIIRQFILTSLLVLPLLTMHMVFDRLARIYMILMYILFVNHPKLERLTIKQVFAYVMFVLSIAWFFFIDIYSTLDGTLLAVLNYSEIFGV